MTRPRVSYLSREEQEFVHEQALRVLEEVGIGYNTPEAIDLLAEAGARVDRAALTAKLPAELVQRCLATCPPQVRLAARDPRHDVVVGDGSLTFCADGTATYMLDDVTGRRSEGSAEWLRRTMRLYDALPEVDYAWPTISARDLDPLTAGLEIEAISLANLTKHVQDEVRDPAHAAPLVEIFEAVAGGSLWDRPIFSTIDCTVAPLQHEREMTEATMAMVRAGVPVLVLPMPLSGTTGPMSVLGTMIVNVAELLSAVVLFQLAQPGCGIISGMGAGVADMRSGLYLCGTPECALMNLIGIEMSRYYGLPCTGSAITCDAKAANQQAGAEGMLTGAACAHGRRRHDPRLRLLGRRPVAQLRQGACWTATPSGRCAVWCATTRSTRRGPCSTTSPPSASAGTTWGAGARGSSTAPERCGSRRCGSGGRSRPTRGGRSWRRPPPAPTRSCARTRSLRCRTTSRPRSTPCWSGSRAAWARRRRACAGGRPRRERP